MHKPLVIQNTSRVTRPISQFAQLSITAQNSAKRLLLLLSHYLYLLTVSLHTILSNYLIAHKKEKFLFQMLTELLVD